MSKNLLISILFITLIAIPANVFAVAGNPLSLSYAGGTGSGASESDFVENTWTYRYQYHVLNMSGDIPQGKLSTQFQVEERDYITGIGYAHMGLSGSTYAIDLGDNVTNFSDLTLNSISYQGASVTLKPSSNFSLIVVGGLKGNGMWGADVRRDTRIKETFTGFRTVLSPASGFGLNATYLATPGGAQVLSYGGEYSLNMLKLGMEYGSAVEGKAFRGEIKYQTNWFSLGTIYRDVDPTYVVPFDYMTYKGQKGTYTSLGINPSNNLTVNVQSNSYIDRLNSTSEASNLDTRGDVSCNFASGTSIGYSGWRNDRTAYERGGVTEGEMMYITQAFCLLTRNAIYYRTQPTWFNSESTLEASYSENKNVTGINIALFDTAHLNYELENTARFMKSTDVTINPTAITARFDLFESQVMETPFYVASSVNYRKDMQNDEESTESTSLYSDFTVKFSPNKDFSCFVTTKVYNMDAPGTSASREQKDLSFGLNCSFNTNFYIN